jgi:hypothetical protein
MSLTKPRPHKLIRKPNPTRAEIAKVPPRPSAKKKS